MYFQGMRILFISEKPYVHTKCHTTRYFAYLFKYQVLVLYELVKITNWYKLRM